jgi:hypothetical protein
MSAPSRAASLRWNRWSYILFSAFLAMIALIGYVWWPLLREYLAGFNPSFPWWLQIDWLLIAIFAAMSGLIMAGADARADVPLAFVGLAGGFIIESWGTRTELWSYYTLERPPLWILPAWPIAALAIDRLARLLEARAAATSGKAARLLQLLVMGGFLVLMVVFVWPTRAQVSTLAAVVLCALLVFKPSDARRELTIFIAGAGLGYFLERWGTTRECWTYYTRQTPPLFAVLAHGMASVAFTRGLDVATRAARWGVGSLRPLLARYGPPDRLLLTPGPSAEVPVQGPPGVRRGD